MKPNKMDKLVVLGAGESGAGAAILGRAKGMDVYVSDYGTIPAKYREVLKSYGIPYEEGGHTMERILEADAIVKSPGIPPTAPPVKAAVEKGIPVVSEIEFAGWYTDAKMVCITGSNGKTTTTLLTYDILRKAGLNVGLAGNVGVSLARQVAEDPKDVYVIELSSFQLENMYDFHANVAIILNITPDHMDRYEHSMELYTAAKFRILQNQTPEDYFIYWAGDPIIAEWLAKVPDAARRLPFAQNAGECICTLAEGATGSANSLTKAEGESGNHAGLAAYTAHGMLHFNGCGRPWEMAREGLSLKGVHNLYNSMAAGLAAGACGIDAGRIAEALSHFAPVEHRLEYVCTVDGVDYINDSKATNVNSTFYALGAMTKPTVLILGGKDKGNDYSEILPLVKEKVKAVVCMGLHNEKLMDFFSGEVPEIRDTHTLADAVRACREIAVDGDVVLLSPCCASFDLFSSYEDRGRQFKDALRGLGI